MHNQGKITNIKASNLIITKITNDDSSNQRNQPNINKTTSANNTHANDIMDNLNDDSSLANGWKVWKVAAIQKGKRIYSSSSEHSSPHTPTNKNKKLFYSTNRYEVLSQNDITPTHPTNYFNLDPFQNPTGSINAESKALYSPPIFVRGVNNFLDMYTRLIELIDVDNFYCKSSTDRLKIITTNPDSYRALVHFLRNDKAEFHTSQLKVWKIISQKNLTFPLLGIIS